jgi:hypothetical protein
MISAFLSYAREDRAIAEAVASALVAAGVQVATPESAVELGGNFAAAIEGRIIEADCVIVLWSTAAVRSEWMEREVKLAIKAWARDRLVLVRVDDADLPPGLRDIPAIDLASDRERGIAEIVRRSGFGIHRLASAASRPMGEAARRRRWVLLAALLLSLIAVAILTFVYLGPRVEVRNTFLGVAQNLGPAAAPAPLSRVRASHSLGPSIFVIIAVGVTLSGALVVWVVIRIVKRSYRAAVPPAVRLSSTMPLPAAPSPSAAHEVFVSYSRRDERLVDRLVAEIESAGLRVWIDRQAEAHGMQRYAAPIVAAIRSSRLVALMCSQNAFASDHVVREVYVAGDFRKPFIAFELDSSEIPDELLYFLSGFPRVPAEPIDPRLIQSEIARFLV